MKNKKNSSFVGKIALPLFVVAVVVGGFSVDWTRFGRTPVSYYGMGAIPMFATCKIDEKNLTKPKQKPSMASNMLPAPATKESKEMTKSLVMKEISSAKSKQLNKVAMAEAKKITKGAADNSEKHHEMESVTALK
ncbi:MAG: hypothetical protein H6849_03455 [Alphaproteobacteria bacterium]|nr:MAG: hypothetical protein H6849_03455 [Alphaproteobacteria bacterium]